MATATKLESYKEQGKYNYPEDDINPELKIAPEWFIAQGAALLSDYTSNNCEIPFDFEGRVSFKTLRAYSQGRQGSQMVKKQLLSNKDFREGLYKTKIKVSFATYDVLPEKIDVIRAINQRQDYEVSASCSDFDSIQNKELEKEYLKYLINPATQELLHRTGFKAADDPKAAGLKTEQDIDFFYDSGGFPMQHELAAIAVINKTRLLSGFKGIENLITQDLIDLSIAGIKNEIDINENVIKQRYVDPANAIIPYSKYYDFRDITRAGEVREISIAEVASINPKLTAKELVELAQSYSYLESNASFRSGINSLNAETIGYGKNGNFSTDNNFITRCRVRVFDFQFLSVDHESYLKDKDRKDGTDIFKPVKYGYELDNREQKREAKVKRSQIIKKYECIWVVGTKTLLKYGVCKNTVYYGPDGNRRPNLDYFFAKTGNQSLVERCMTHVDDVNMQVIKLRNAVAMLPPAPRMVIRQGALDNVYIGKKKQEPDDLIQTLVERGYIIVSDTDIHGNPIFQNGKAVDFMNTNIAEDVNIFNGLIRDSIARIGQVLGLPEGLDGTNVGYQVGKGKLEMAADASSNALYPTLGRLNDIFDPANNDVIKKWQGLAKNKDVSIAYSPLGAGTQKILELSANFTTADFNIETKLGPNDQQKAEMIQKLTELSLAYDQSSGSIGISGAEYLMAQDLIMAGNIKLAQFKLAQIQKNRLEEAKADKANDQQTNITSQTASMQAAEQEKRSTSDMEETNKQRTAIVIGAEARKNTIIAAYLKSKGDSPIEQSEINALMAVANAEIAGAMQLAQPSPQPNTGQEQPPQQQEMAA